MNALNEKMTCGARQLFSKPAHTNPPYKHHLDSLYMCIYLHIELHQCSILVQYDKKKKININ